MPGTARLEDEVPGPADHHLVAHLHPYLALEHIAVLVLALVHVHGSGKAARCDRMLDQREAALGLVADHEASPHRADLDVLSLLRAEDYALRGGIHRSSLGEHGVHRN